MTSPRLVATTVPQPRAYRPAGHVCDAECWHARGPKTDCVCECQGRFHGYRREAAPVLVDVVVGSDELGQRVETYLPLTRVEVARAVSAQQRPTSMRDPFARIPVDLDDDAF